MNGTPYMIMTVDGWRPYMGRPSDTINRPIINDMPVYRPPSRRDEAERQASEL